jgi:hypothetical protein
MNKKSKARKERNAERKQKRKMKPNRQKKANRRKKKGEEMKTSWHTFDDVDLNHDILSFLFFLLKAGQIL